MVGRRLLRVAQPCARSSPLRRSLSAAHPARSRVLRSIEPRRAPPANRACARRRNPRLLLLLLLFRRSPHSREAAGAVPRGCAADVSLRSDLDQRELDAAMGWFRVERAAAPTA